MGTIMEGNSRWTQKNKVLITYEIMQQTMRYKRPHFWEGDFLVCFYERRRWGEETNELATSLLSANSLNMELRVASHLSVMKTCQ
jgi:hypothetical protein